MKSETKTNTEVKPVKEAIKQTEKVITPSVNESKEIKAAVTNFLNSALAPHEKTGAGGIKKITEKKSYKTLKDGGLIDAYQCK